MRLRWLLWLILPALAGVAPFLLDITSSQSSQGEQAQGDPDHDHSTHDHSAEVGVDVEATPAAPGELPPEAGRIIGSPEAGPKPEQSGDRGGWLQLVTLAAVAASVTLIMIRVLKAVRQPQPSNS